LSNNIGGGAAAAAAGGGSEGDKPQFVPSEAMTTSTKEMLPPPDREAVRFVLHGDDRLSC